MAEFPEEELKEMAIQIFGEIKLILGDGPEVRRHLEYTARNWGIVDDADFVAIFPGEDPKKAYATFRYILGNWDEISRQRTSVTSDIPI